MVKYIVVLAYIVFTCQVVSSASDEEIYAMLSPIAYDNPTHTVENSDVPLNDQKTIILTQDDILPPTTLPVTAAFCAEDRYPYNQYLLDVPHEYAHILKQDGYFSGYFKVQEALEEKRRQEYIPPDKADIWPRFLIPQKSHKIDKSYRCTLCEKAFSTSTALKLHVHTYCKLKYLPSRQLTTPLTQQRYTCSICPTRHTSLDSFQRHVRTHLILRPYFCPYCPHSGVKVWVVQRHLRRSHNKIVNYDIVQTYCNEKKAQENVHQAELFLQSLSSAKQ